MAKFNKTIETPKGNLEYRFPNIAEGFSFLAQIDAITTYKDALVLKGKFTTMMGDLINYKALGYSSYDDFLDDRENNYQAVAKIADEIYIELANTLAKKT